MTLEIVPDDGVAGVVGDMIPSINGAAGEKHFVSPKASDEIPINLDVVLKATGVSVETFQSSLKWDDEGGEAVPGEPLKRRVKRDATGKTEVRIKDKSTGEVVKKLNVWVHLGNGDAAQGRHAGFCAASPRRRNGRRGKIWPPCPRGNLELRIQNRAGIDH